MALVRRNRKTGMTEHAPPEFVVELAFQAAMLGMEKVIGEFKRFMYDEGFDLYEEDENGKMSEFEPNIPMSAPRAAQPKGPQTIKIAGMEIVVTPISSMADLQNIAGLDAMLEKAMNVPVQHTPEPERNVGVRNLDRFKSVDDFWNNLN